MKMKLLQNISTIAVSPRGRRYIVSFASVDGENEVALIDEATDKFISLSDHDVAPFYSFADLSEIMTIIREKIIDLDVGFAIDAQKIDISDIDIQRSIDLHPAGKLTHLHIQ
jgi:hypothetical protein